MIGRHYFVVNGQVIGGVRIVFTADIFGEAVHGFIREVTCFLEQEMFEEVCKSGASSRVIFAADVVPDLDGYIGAAMLFEADHTHPVCKGLLAWCDVRRSWKCWERVRVLHV